MLSGKAFGEAGARIVVEEHMTGREVSFFVLADGATFTPLATCQDYKRALDGDRGPNTGGMGSYSPSVHLDDANCRRIETELVAPALAGLAAEQRPYQGVLYVGVMLTDAGPRVLEFNARFGDPETQALLPRLDGDWLPLLHACAAGGLAQQRVAWTPDASVCVVLASEGYPGTPVLGREIRGLDAAGSHPGVVVFHAGTKKQDGRWLTRGGRVLGLSAQAPSLEAAREAAYRAANDIDWEGKQLRTDIALDAIARLEGEKRR
jgi:phosphoribosylamine--glycine ligase